MTSSKSVHNNYAIPISYSSFSGCKLLVWLCYEVNKAYKFYPLGIIKCSRKDRHSYSCLAYNSPFQTVALSNCQSFLVQRTLQQRVFFYSQPPLIGFKRAIYHLLKGALLYHGRGRGSDSQRTKSPWLPRVSPSMDHTD